MRPILRPLLLLLALPACVPPPGNQLAPVDYVGGGSAGSYADYEARRLGRPAPLGGPGTGPASAADPAISADDLRAAGLPSGGNGTSTGPGTGAGGLPAAEPVPTRSIDDAFEDATDSRTGGPEASAAPATRGPSMPANNPGISDEQSFAAVSSRESIESDAARLERQRAAYTTVAPRAVPVRQGDAGPNIVGYALATSHPVGQQVHARGGLFVERRARSACAGFASPDIAQQEFLRRGGPERDRLGVDPDGDGYACGWNPAPFRAARG